ncbi:MAG TPA: tRNA pseudouridine(55) synthase TruB [Phycisphaerae bacterium]|nr:tRNA pseudouridine(55) synthase TruB [Phycisphaerae bacterium]HPS53333.1 tRNA pseudouridine(55) synthase TruB [Phycisphaerae bacterium]
MFGFISINKPQGPTSFDIVAGVRRMLSRKTKVGHTGTLDPFARGVLVVCVNKATRLANYVQRSNKRYRAEITLGRVSDTDDVEGNITDFQTSQPLIPPDESAVRNVLCEFTGQIMQIPPAHSAVHVGGQRAYVLARQGAEFEIAPRPVVIHEIKLLSYSWPILTVAVYCGSGTYIRSLARDIGCRLNVGGYCSALQRTAVGMFDIESSVDFAELTADNIAEKISMPLGALGLEIVTLADGQLESVSAGRSIVAPPGLKGREIALITADGRLAAIADMCGEGMLHPVRVFL